MNFGEAIAAMKEGYKVARSDWDEKCIFLLSGKELAKSVGSEDLNMEFGNPWISHTIIEYNNREYRFNWNPTSEDMLSEDWTYVKACCMMGITHVYRSDLDESND